MEEIEYKKIRDAYKPSRVKVIFVLESPPANGTYFYSTDNGEGSSLYRCMMRFVLNLQSLPATKSDGLRMFQKSGYFIIDSTYAPINDMNQKLRDMEILSNYNNLVSDLKNIIVKNKVSIVLIKANVCGLLEKRLLKDGFNVINDGLVIPFPGSGQQTSFCEKINRLI